MNRFLFIALAFLLPATASAASLYVTPSSGSYGIGDTISATIYVESTGQSLNALSGTLSVPSDAFDIVGVSIAGSIVNFWVTEPSNRGSSVAFEGVVLNPGYSGSAGKIASVTLRAKRAGSAALTYTSASILANDGKGTSILSGTRGATYTIREGAAPAPVVEEEDEETPAVVRDDEAGPTVRSFAEIGRASASDPSLRVRVEATDPSGIASYEFSLDGGAYLSWSSPEDGVYELSLGPGAHTLALRVTDRLGNETRRQILIAVAALTTPEVLSFPPSITVGEEAVVTGTAASGITQVVLTATPEVVDKLFSIFGFSSISTVPKRIEATVGADGRWEASLAELPAVGRYAITVTAYDARGAASFPTEPFVVEVTSGWILGALSFLLSVPVLLVIVIGLGALAVLKVHAGRGQVHERVAEVQKSLKHSFATMRRNIDKERVILHRRRDDASEREEELLEALEENIETAESRAEEKLAGVERAAEKNNGT